jgi:glycosyltransferase involved in cell wall biosynthesis
MRIAWIAPYPAQLLEPGLQVSRKVDVFHPCSWIVNLSETLAHDDSVDLHLLTDNHLVPRSQTVKVGKITFHVLKSGIPFTNRRFPPSLPLDAISRFHFITKRLMRELQEIQPDVVHAHGTEGPYALAGAKSGYPCVISMQGIVSEIEKATPSFRSRFVKGTEQAAVRSNRYFICRTEFDSSFVRSVNPQARIFFIHEAMNPVYFRNEWRPNDSCSILFVGQLLKRKGVEDLLQAVARVKEQLPKVRLQLVGAGSDNYVRHLKELCAQLSIADNVEFLGFKSAEQIAKHHLANQLFVLPSENENSPNTLAEAMVSGLPVIATAVGGIPSMVQNGQTGRLVERNNPQLLATAMIELLTHADERKRLSENARRVARDRHRPETVAQQTMRAYRELLDSSKGTA